MTASKSIGSMAILAGFSALAYAYFFVVARNELLYSVSLALLGLFSFIVFVSLSPKLRTVDENLARLAAGLASIGALGALLHGGYDLANAINPPLGANPNLPNMVDPRGLLAFGLTGLGILFISHLLRKSSAYPTLVPWVGYLAGLLLIEIYFARLIILDPAHPLLLYPVLVQGFLIGPLWYLWLGITLRRYS